MKRFHVIASIIFLFFVVFSIVSCNKSKEEFARPQQDAALKAGSKDATDSKEGTLKDVNSTDLSSSDDGGSPGVAWDQEPEELKNAIPITSAEAAVACSPWGNFGPFGGLSGSAFEIRPPGCA